jgi:ATP-dependent helicase/nuclease subunit A
MAAKQRSKSPASVTPASQPADAAVRLAALDPRQSFIVQAPAGSGKTELLVARYLTLLADETVEVPENVLAITFTRKATAEMRDRVVGALERAAQISRDDESDIDVQRRRLAERVLDRSRQLGWKLLENPGRLEIRTFDSLCNDLASRSPLAAGAGLGWQVNQDNGIYDEAARRTLLDSRDDTRTQPLGRVLAHLDNNLERFRRMLASQLESRALWVLPFQRLQSGGEALRQHLENSLRAAVEEELAALRGAAMDLGPDLIARLTALAEQCAGRVDDNASLAILRGEAELPGAGFEDQRKWCALRDWLLKEDGTIRVSPNRKQGFPPKSDDPSGPLYKAAFEEIGRELRERELALRAEAEREGLPQPEGFLARLRDLRFVSYAGYEFLWPTIEATWRVLTFALQHLKDLFRERGVLDFIEIGLAALEALGTTESPNELSLARGDRLRHLLVDEFQDTSLIQFELLRRLVCTWDPGDGNTLFLVGDPMQSIYGFRQAEVELFDRTRRRGIAGLRPAMLRLTVNFRSSEKLVNWHNQSFAAILNREDPLVGAVPYAPATAAPRRADDGANRAPGAGSPDEDTHFEHFRCATVAEQCDRVVGLVAEALKTQRSGRFKDEADIAVLVRSRGALADLPRRLRKAGIPFRALEFERLDEQPAVLDLLALTRALLHLGDRTAWLALLRAPWCGLTLADLAALCENDPDTTVWELLQRRSERLSADARRRLDRLLPILNAALHPASGEDLAHRIERAWISLGAPAAFAGDDCDRRSALRDAEAFFRLLGELQSEGIPDAARLQSEVARLYSPPDVNPEIRVVLTTIHQAKGLEYETVILPVLEKPGRNDSKPLFYCRERVDHEGGSDLVFGMLDARGTDGSGSVAAYLDNLRKKRQDEERKRTLYVAATRARRNLYLLHSASKFKHGTFVELLRRTPSWPAENGPADAASPQPQPSAVADVTGQQPAAPQLDESRPALDGDTPSRPSLELHRLPLDWRLPQPPPALKWSGLPAPGAVEDRHTYEWVGLVLPKIGIVTHAWLQQIASDGLAAWSAERIHESAPAVQNALHMQGVPAHRLDEAAERVLRALDQTLKDQQGRWILGDHDEAQNESSFTTILDGRLIHVRMDRTFVEAGVRWIVDYKTSEHRGGDIGAFLDREVAKYRPDIERYRRVLAISGDADVRAGLYFPLLGAWREVN